MEIVQNLKASYIFEILNNTVIILLRFVQNYLPALLVFLFFLVFLYVFIKLVLKLLTISLHLKQKFAVLEVKPPQETLQSSYTTQQLFSLIHGLAKQRSWLYHMLGFQKSYAFEIVSSKNEGIRYLLRVNEEDADLIKKGLMSYLPGITVTEITDYLPEIFNESNAAVFEFVLSNHFAFPLKRQDELKEHDPIAYITGSMTKLAANEVVAFQLVASPLNKGWIRDIKRISHLIYSNDDLVQGLKSSSGLGIVKFVFGVALQILMLPLGLFIFLVSDGKEGPLLSLGFGGNRKKTPNPYQEELELLVKGKLDQPLFTASVRLLVLGNKQDSFKRNRGFISSLSSLSNSYQSIRLSYFSKFKPLNRLKIFAFKNRLLSFFDNSIMSVSEVSDLYHFPFTQTTRTEDIQKIHSKELPAPVSLKKATDLDVVFAKIPTVVLLP